MAALKTLNCPSCAGDIAYDGASERVTCRYCGTTSFVQQGRRKAPTGVPVIVVAAGIPWLFALTLGLGAAFTGGMALFLALRSDSSVPPPPAPKVALAPLPPAKPAPAPEPAPPPAPVTRVLSDTPVLFADLDGDQHADVIAPIAVTLAGTSAEHYAVFDGQSGAPRARTPALPERRSALIALLGRRLLIAQRDGQLSAFDLGSGDAQWSSALGERVAALCTGTLGGAVHVTTDAGRKLYLDLVTGRQTETREPCAALLARAESARDPRDRRDYQAPFGVESYRCGGVRVMGDQNYNVPDACLAHARVDSDRLDGMVGHRLWRQGSDWLVFGVRTPGTYVPMVGRVRRGKLVWKSEVPAENPLAAEEGGPRYAALAGDQLVLAYASGRPARWSLTAFAAQEGARRWTRELPEDLRGGVHTLGAYDNRVFVQADDALLLLDAARGELANVVGGGR